MFRQLLSRNHKLFQQRFATTNIFELNKENTNVIQMPKYMENGLPKWKKKLREKRIIEQSHIQFRGDLSIPVICCKDKKLNFYSGQIYSSKKPIPLASQKWYKGGKINGDHFTIQKHGDNPGLPVNKKIDTFDLEQKLKDGLNSLGITNPTPIQDVVLQRKEDIGNSVFIAETGCGKTLAFLIPILNKLLKQKNNSSPDQKPSLNRPKALIVAPSIELVQQIGNVTEALGKFCGLNTKILLGGSNTKALIRNPEFEEVDIVISPLGTIKSLTQLYIYDLKDLQYMVLDEIDTLLDDSFVHTLKKLLQYVNFHPPARDGEKTRSIEGAGLVMTGATIPVDISMALDDILDVETLDIVHTPNVNTVQPHITHTFKRICANDKHRVVLELVQKSVLERKPVLCFTNKANCCTWLSLFLQENGVVTCELHGKLDLESRRLNLEKFQSGEVDVAVCTDLGSRGIDTLRVQHIINFDTPLHTSDYLHRAGRVGRVGGATNTTVTSLVSKPRECMVVQKIEKSVRTNSSIDDVNANIKKVLRERKRHLTQL